MDESSLIDINGTVSPHAADLLSLAGAAFVADRSEPRGRNPDDPRWHRSLSMEVQVRNPEVWRTPVIQDKVIELLTWLTDDRWLVSFVQRRTGEPPRQVPLAVDTADRDVALFSGGLDATAGIAQHLQSRPVQAVGVVTNPMMRGYQRRVVTALQQSGLGDLQYSPLPFSLVGQEARDDEPTRRTRGLVFLCVGSAASLQSRQQRLLVFENGVGALNLPFTSAQSGAMTSRAVHPHTLRMMSNLIGLLTGQDFLIENPCLPLTKGEMVASLPHEAELPCAHSESCDNAAAGRGALQKRCGYCTSCLLRRVSFHAADRVDWDPRPYRVDTIANPGRDRLPEVLWQAATWDRALRSKDEGDLLRCVPALDKVPVEDLDRRAQRRLLTTYVDEWRRYPHESVRRYLDDAPLGGHA